MFSQKGIDLEETIKELVEYGFDLDDNKKRKIVELVDEGVSIEAMKKGFVKEVAENVWSDLKTDYEGIIEHINIEAFIKNREKEYNIEGQAYRDVVEFLENRKERLSSLYNPPYNLRVKGF